MNIKLSNLHYTYSYGLYLALGLIPWMMFSSILLKEARVFFEKKHLIEKLPISLYYYPLSILFAEFTIFLIYYFLLFFIIYFLGLQINFVWILFSLLASLFLALFGFSLGILIAVFSIFIRDLQEIAIIILNVWFWITPIVYTMDIIPPKFYFLFELNPIFAFFEIFHSLIMKSKFLKIELVIYDFITVVLVLIISLRLIKKLESEIRDFL